MNWDYFIVDGKFKIRKFPVTKGTVKIQDITDIDSAFRTEMKNYGKTIEESKEIFTEYYSGVVEVEVELFDEYFDRNIKNFLGDLKGLKGKYSFIMELFYWDDNEYWGEERSLETWDWLYESDQEFCPNRKTLSKMENLEIIEIKASSEKSHLLKYIESNAAVDKLNNIAMENSVSISGKKAEKINQLIDALEKGLIKHTTINMFRPGKNFKAWHDTLQLKYIDELEFAVSTFDYPEYFLVLIWEESVLLSEFPLIEKTIKERQKKIFDVIAQNEERSKNINIPKQSNDEFEIDGINITITTSIDTDANEIEKKASSPKNNIGRYYLNKRKQKKAEAQEKQLLNERISLLLVAIVMIVLFLVFT